MKSRFAAKTDQAPMWAQRCQALRRGAPALATNSRLDI
jgi:hypothetical protein